MYPLSRREAKKLIPVYMGYAFLPIAIGYFIAGPLGGYMLHYFGDVLKKPQLMWWVVAGIGIAGTLLMVVYDRIFRPGEPKAEGKAA